jgi:hypothetical protein
MNFPTYIGTSKQLKGIRGVFAKKKILKGSVIEVCPIILFPNKDLEHIEQTVLNFYEYVWDANWDCVVLGYGSLYNHSYKPNAMFKRDVKNTTMYYVALRTIAKDEEITVNYNEDPTDLTELEPGYLDYSK